MVLSFMIVDKKNCRCGYLYFVLANFFYCCLTEYKVVNMRMTMIKTSNMDKKFVFIVLSYQQ